MLSSSLIGSCIGSTIRNVMYQDKIKYYQIDLDYNEFINSRLRQHINDRDELIKSYRAQSLINKKEIEELKALLIKKKS